MKPFPLLFSVLFLIFSACKVQHVAQTKPSYYSIAAQDTIREDAHIDSLIAPYKSKLDAQMQTVIGHCAKELILARPESPLGNWFADALHEQTELHSNKNIDFTISNYGGIRIKSLPAGPITRGAVFEIMPFENQLVALQIDSATIVKLFDWMKNKNGWPISHATYEIFNTKVRKITIQGKPLANKTYTLLTSDYLANGGDDCVFLKDLKRENLNYLLRDALLDCIARYEKMGKAIDGSYDRRVKVINE